METCRDVMTPNPAFCLPEDTIKKAVEIMKAQDIGSVPVVEEPSHRKLLGIVTDRDIALNIVEKHSENIQDKPISEVMTQGPVTCRENDDIEVALEAMSEHKLRRIPVVDSQAHLLGIIAQADIARKVGDEVVGNVVKEISESE